jgi:hypothetical protein
MIWDKSIHSIPPSILSSFVSSIFHLVSPSTVENLVLELDQRYLPPLSVLEATLRPFATVTQLRLENSLPQDLLSAMEFMPLCMLVISQTYFSPVEGDDYELLSHFLKRRLQQHKTKLQYLQLLDCWDVTDDQLAALKTMASRVSLDCNPSLEEVGLDYSTNTDFE